MDDYLGECLIMHPGLLHGEGVCEGRGWTWDLMPELQMKKTQDCPLGISRTCTSWDRECLFDDCPQALSPTDVLFLFSAGLVS